MEREEQIELIKECILDAEAAINAVMPALDKHMLIGAALAFFRYRARQRSEPDIPCSSTDKAADVEED